MEGLRDLLAYFIKGLAVGGKSGVLRVHDLTTEGGELLTHLV